MLGNIKIAFGQVLGRELLELKCKYPPDDEKGEGGEADKRAAGGTIATGEGTAEGHGNGSSSAAAGEGLQFTASGYISNANYNMKKSIFMLFINNRMVSQSTSQSVNVCAFV